MAETIISIDSNDKLIKYCGLTGNSENPVVCESEFFSSAVFSDEFFEELADLIMVLDEKYHFVATNNVNIILPDTAVAMDQLSIPVVKGVNKKSSFGSAISNLFPNTDDVIIQNNLLLQTKQLITCSYTFVNSSLIKNLRASCLKNKIKIKNISFAANTTQIAVSSYASKLKASTYLLLDIKKTSARFVFVYKGKCVAFFNLPFGYEVMEKSKVVAENMLFNHDLAELEVLNAKERARAKALTVLRDDYNILETARAKTEQNENGDELPADEESEKAPKPVVKPVNIKTLPPKTERVLPKYMQRPEPTTEEELVYENFRLFEKWALNLLNENDKIVTLGGFDTVYVNMPSKYTFVLEESNKEAEENGVLFAPLDIKKPTTVLENLDLVGGHMIGRSNRNVF